MDTRLALMTGCDYPIPECQLTLHQPTIKEIGLIGENDFLQAHSAYLFIKVCSSQRTKVL